jgi:translation initiation factor 2B subunit (eIF-2B alpha/beta/delta family)
MPRDPWQNGLNELRRDHRSGASEILGKALDLLIDAIADSTVGSASAYHAWLLRIARQLIGTQPAMGVLFRLVNDMLWACHAAATGTLMRQQALDFCQAYRARRGLAMDALVSHAAQYMGRNLTLLTYSRSATVAHVLEALGQSQPNLHVLCSECRPLLEGQALASQLAWAGVRVTLGVDMALFGWLPEANALVVGADAIAGGGLVNKLGTAELAHAAHRIELPVLVVCTTDKLLPTDYALAQGLRAGKPDEIMPVSNDNVTILNPYFDITPLELVTAVLTEEGVLAGESLKQRLGTIQIYPGLRGGGHGHPR